MDMFAEIGFGAGLDVEALDEPTKRGLADVKYFWSLTMYDLTNNLVENPIDRWAIGSLAGGYKMADDGSLTLFIQNESPGKEKEANWLPAPAGDFWVVFRTYRPSKELIEQSWKMPPLERVD
jgi:hypothetical protein